MNRFRHSETQFGLAAVAVLVTVGSPSAAHDEFSSALSPWRASALAAATVPAQRPSLLDQIAFGDASSEQRHELTALASEAGKGALGQPERRFLPGGGAPWEGGKVAFTVNVDPTKQTYVTARFWGSDVDENYLILFCEGKQVGYRHLGDVSVLGVPDAEPRYNGRFFYVTTPLPLAMTRGKSEVHLEVRATGHIWGYGGTFELYQKPMTQPARPIYNLYTHTDGCFTPPPGEVQGQPPAPALRSAPGPEVLAQVKSRVNRELDGMLKSGRPLNQMQLQFLARAYFVKWTPAYNNKRAFEQIVKGVDEIYGRWRRDPEQVWNDKSTWNPGWFGVGPAGDAVRLLAKRLAESPLLDQPLDGVITRRAGWSALFRAGRDHLRTDRRWLTNQAMFSDVNIYLANRAVAAIDAPNALPESKALDYLYQSIGLTPWVGSDTPNGSTKPFGDSFYQVTEKGLTRELGYVGGYGEVGTAGAMEIYEATREPGGGEGDPKIKAQLAKMIRARGIFRYPMLDTDGNRAMRLETGVGWRDEEFPGAVVYSQRGGGEQSPLRETAATLDPAAIGFAQEMFDDNQFFASIADVLKDNRFRNTVGLLGVPDEYELLTAQPPSRHRLPMSWDQPDFVFADEQDGVVAIKNGKEILFASLYWRAQFGINSLAQTHYLTPSYQQVATVHEDTMFTPSGKTYVRPDWINFGFGNGGTNIHYPADLHQAYTGEKLPIAQWPVALNLSGDQPTRFYGMGEFYALRYGPYLIGMNMTTDKTFTITVPPDAKSVKELVSKRSGLLAGSTEKVGPRSTVVFYLVDR